MNKELAKKLCPNTKECEAVMIQYGYGGAYKHYDGVSEVKCTKHNRRFGRWCEQELFDGESENVFCNGKTTHKDEGVSQR